MSASRPATAPLHFGPPERTLFGWYHEPTGRKNPCGVVVCNPVGDDYIRAHRTLRHLAERLQAAGFPVLRFDFHGTGDSADDERAAGRVRAWLDDVSVAADELRARSGAASVAVCGLRLGATLAMAAAAERCGTIDSLVLWSPYSRGDAFVRESTRLHQMHRMLEPESFAAEPPNWRDGGEQALGFLLTDETIADLGELDLLALNTRPARAALVIGAGDVTGEGQLVQHLRSLGTDTSARNPPDHKFLLMIPHRSVVPDEALEAIVGWLGERHQAGEQPRPPLTAPVNARAADGLADEQPLVFGASESLFGILVRPPAHLRRSDLPAIIMLNAGCVHRIGPHRFYVGLARRWAKLGFNSLRLDLSGIGDSVPTPGQEENRCYPANVVNDLDQAMEQMRIETGARQAILIGLCSGADLAFQTGLSDPRAAGVVMMNPRTFCVNDLDMVAAYQQARWYQDSLSKGTKWLKLLRGEVNVVRAAQHMVPKVRDIVVSRTRELLHRLQPRQEHPVERPEQADVAGCLRTMAERGVDTLLVVSEHDPGIDYVDAHFGNQMRALNDVRGFRRSDLAGTDHTFTSRYSQGVVSDLITEHLAARHMGGA